MRQGLLFFKNRIHVGRAVHLQLQVLNFVHYDSVAGHLGYERTCREPEGIFIGREWRKVSKDSLENALFAREISRRIPYLLPYYNPFQFQ
jgi:hypothetical protein